MKFLFFHCDDKKQEIWFLPVVFAAGIIIGISSIFLVTYFSPAKRALKTQQVQQQASTAGVFNQVSTSPDQVVEQKSYILGDIQASWMEPKELSRKEVEDLIMGATTNTAFAERALSSGTSSTQATQCDSLVRNIWSIGEITDGEFRGSPLYYAGVEGFCGMGESYITYDILAKKEENGEKKLYRFVENKEWMTNACNDSNADPYSCITRVAQGKFESLHTPSTLHLENGKRLVYITSETFLIPKSMQSQMKIIAKTKTRDPIYERPDIPEVNPFATHASSIGILDSLGRFQEYGSFINANDYILSTSTYFNGNISNDDIQWTQAMHDKLVSSLPDKKSNDEEYTPMARDGGCGGGSTNYVVVNKDSLERIGTYRDSNDPVYLPRDLANDSKTKKVFDQWLAMDGGKKTMDDFLRLNPAPYFLWQNAFGDWIEYTSTAVVPQAECGKPVIYLYPPTTTEVTVKLPKFIHVTVSDPAYPTTGWHVTASSSGMLISKDDGKIYNSLYWEGTGVNFRAPKTGFVVKGSDASSFLQKTLPKYGLNQKEATEFMDFWVPKLKGAPYYQISFLTDDWSKAAPLSVSPRPQTSIRLFMDWKPLSAPVSIIAPKIITPVRNGFTLVEWGGTLYK